MLHEGCWNKNKPLHPLHGSTFCQLSLPAPPPTSRSRSQCPYSPGPLLLHATPWLIHHPQGPAPNWPSTPHPGLGVLLHGRCSLQEQKSQNPGADEKSISLLSGPNFLDLDPSHPPMPHPPHHLWHHNGDGVREIQRRLVTFNHGEDWVPAILWQGWRDSSPITCL